MPQDSYVAMFLPMDVVGIGNVVGPNKCIQNVLWGDRMILKKTMMKLEASCLMYYVLNAP